MTSSPLIYGQCSVISGLEEVPPIITNQTQISIMQSTDITAWWWNSQTTQQGIVKAVPFVWSDLIAQFQATPAIIGQQPNCQTDSGTGQSFLGFGYGTGTGTTQTLTQFTEIVASAELYSTGGTNYAVGDSIVLNDGAVTHTTLSVTSLASTITNAIGAVTISTPGTYSGTNQPSNPISQFSTTGTGSGAQWVLDTGTANGSLVTAASSPVIPSATAPLTFIAVARIPVVNGYAGPTPGGALIGNALNHSSFFFNTGADVRWTGLAVGIGANPGREVFNVTGDSNSVGGPTGTDFRDGKWHVFMGGCTPSSGTTTPGLWVDGSQIGTSTLGSLTLNTTAGNRQIRIGAVGLPNTTPNWGLAGDFGTGFVFSGIDLTLSANTTERQLVTNYLLAQWGIGGSSN